MVKSRLIPHLFTIAGLAILSGCAFLDKLDPADKGKPVLQAGVALQTASTQPVVTVASGAIPGAGSVPSLLFAAGSLLIAGWQGYEHVKDHNAVAAAADKNDKVKLAADVAANVADALKPAAVSAKSG